MSLVREFEHNVVVTSSIDRTVKVWDLDQILEVVPQVQSMTLKIDKVSLKVRTKQVHICP